MENVRNGQRVKNDGDAFVEPSIASFSAFVVKIKASVYVVNDNPLPRPDRRINSCSLAAQKHELHGKSQSKKQRKFCSFCNTLRGQLCRGKKI